MIRTSLFRMWLAVLAISPLCAAQSEPPASLDSTFAVVRAGIQADKATIVGQGMAFNDKDAAVFWPIYRQYEYERSKLDDGREAVIKEYAQKFPNLSDDEAKDMATRIFECDSRLAELKKVYFKKFNKVLLALTVTKFFQLEHRIDLVTDVRMESSLPPLAQTQFSEQPK